MPYKVKTQYVTISSIDISIKLITSGQSTAMVKGGMDIMFDTVETHW